MAKILLVEDDKSLREIYGVRLLAEGYDIVSAGDGEEALAMAIKDRPDLIISDVMMPKISGFDMLDILRSTSETKGIKVIMMTALSSEDQRARGEALGADRYLVKSQVGIEDVVRTVHDVLGDTPNAQKAATSVFNAPAPRPAAPAPTAPTPAPVPPAPVVPEAPAPPVVTAPAPAPIAAPVEPVIPAAPALPPVPPAPVVPDVPSLPPIPAAPATPIAPPAPAAPVVPPAPVAPVEVVPAPTPVQAAPTPAPAAPLAPPSIAPQQYITTPPSTEQPGALPEPTAPFSSNPPASLGERILQPLEPTGPTVDMNALISQELGNGQAGQPPQPGTLPPVPPAV